MHILTIHGDKRPLEQGVVRIDWPRLEFDHLQPSATLHRRFLKLFCQAADLWQSLPIVSASVRMRVSPNAPPASWHAITADALDKPILASSFSTAPLAGGLGYIFASLPFVAGKEADVTAALIRAIRKQVPEAVASGAGGQA